MTEIKSDLRTEYINCQRALGVEPKEEEGPMTLYSFMRSDNFFHRLDLRLYHRLREDLKRLLGEKSKIKYRFTFHPQPSFLFGPSAVKGPKNHILFACHLIIPSNLEVSGLSECQEQVERDLNFTRLLTSPARKALDEDGTRHILVYTPILDEGEEGEEMEYSSQLFYLPEYTGPSDTTSRNVPGIHLAVDLLGPEACEAGAQLRKNLQRMSRILG